MALMDTVPYQGIICRIMNVALYHCAVLSDLADVLESFINGNLIDLNQNLVKGILLNT